MSGLRIAFIVDKSGPFYIGGYEGKIWNLARRLANDNDVRIYTSLTSQSKTLENVLFVRVCSQSLSPPERTDRNLAHGFIFGLALVSNPFKSWVPDVVAIEAIPYFQLLTSARWLGTLSATKILMVDEAWESYSYWPGLLAVPSKKIIRRLLDRGIGVVNRVTATSSVTKQSIARLFGDDLDVRVLPDGVDSDGIGRRLKSGRSADTYDFVTVGRLVPIKRQTDFVSALARMKQSARWRGKAAIVGSGPLENSLRKSITVAGLESQVDLKVKVDDDELFDILAASKVFVLCSEREGFSHATLQALSFGLPAIVARPPQPEVFGVSDFVRDRENGLYFDLGRIDQLSSAMDELLTDGDLWGRLSKNASTLVVSYSWDMIIARFREIIQKPPGRRPEGLT